MYTEGRGFPGQVIVKNLRSTAPLTCFLVLALGQVAAADASFAIRGRVLAEPGGVGVEQVPVRVWSHADGESRFTETGQEGEYVFEEVVLGIYTLRIDRKTPGIWSDGVVVEVKDVAESLNAHCTASDLCLRLPQSVSGTVIDLDTGKPAPGVGISFSTADRNRAEVASDEEGRYCLYVVPRQVEIHCTGTQERYYVENPVDNSKGIAVERWENVDSVDYEVRSAPKLTGRVTLPNGDPASGLFVLLVAMWSRATQHPARIEEAQMRIPEDQQEAMRAIQWTMQQLDVDKDHRDPETGTGGGAIFRLTTDQAGNFVGYLRRPSLFRSYSTEGDEGLDLVLATRLPDSSLGMYTLLETTTLDRPPRDIEVRLQPTASALFTITDPDGNAMMKARPLPFTGMGMDLSPALKPEFESLGRGKYRVNGLLPGREYRFGAQAPGHEPVTAHNGLRVIPKPGEEIDLGILQLEQSQEPHNLD